MSWRRPLLTLLLVMLAVSMLSAPTRTTKESAPAPRAAPAAAPPVIRATLPAARAVRAPEGRVVELRVTSLQPDIARIDELGLHGPVGPDLTGPTLRFVAGPVGTYQVRLDIGGTRVGTVEVVTPKAG